MRPSLRRVALGVCELMALAGAGASAGPDAVMARMPRAGDVTIRGGPYAAINGNDALLVTRASANPEFVRRALLDFDTQSAIPAGATVMSATLTLTVHWGGVTKNRDVAVYDVTRPSCRAEATRDVASASTPWTKPGGDFGREYARAAVPNAPGAKAVFTVTRLVQAAVNASGWRHSLMALIDAGSLATNYTGVAHPSLPNYMALTGGEPVFTTDCVGCTTPARHVFDEAVDAGRPFVHDDDVVKNKTRCANHVVPFSAARPPRRR